MKRQVALVGIGGCGSNILKAVLEKHADLTASMVIDRDKQAIKKSQAAENVFLKAHSAKQVERATERHKTAICQFLKGKNELMIFAGMGGCTGTFASPLIAFFAKELNLPTLVFITLPFGFEGKDRMEFAQAAQKRLVTTDATVATFTNQDMIKNVPANTSMLDAFRIVDMETIKFIESSLYNPRKSS